MTQDVTTQEATSHSFKPKRLHAKVLNKIRKQQSTYLLGDEEFRFAADCERMRVDRNGSVLSLLLVKLHEQNHESLAFFSRVLEGRLRVTDTPGHLSDGRVAILLPDTPAEGAWKVASDVSEVYPAGPGRPECEVLVYQRTKGGLDFDSSEDGPGEPEQEEIATGGAAGASREGTNPSNTFFFAETHPVWKRSLDILGSSAGLLASLPILAVAGLAVKTTSRGPAFFRQEREGLEGKRFHMWKLRTMQVDAEAKKKELRKFSQQDGPAFKMKKDPRTTTVGRFLRWTSMDELPQFWNVLKGDMSLVGPRPLPTEESEACEGWQRRRLRVKPGMTCTWQVSERGNVSFDEWVRMDLRYAQQRSLFGDLRLMVMTLPSLLMQKGMR